MRSIGILFLLACSACSHGALQSHISFPTETAPYVQNWDERKIATLSQYQINGTCAGLPRIKVKTAPGFCVGLVDNGEGMLFPRTAAEADDHQIFVVDMGGWAENNGRLYSLKYNGGKYQRTLRLKAQEIKDLKKKAAMDRPHLVLRGPDGLLYLGSATSISRFDPKASDIEKSLEILVSNIPAQGLHPLKAFTFDDKGNIFVNLGSATNDCEKQGFYFEKSQSCTEVESNESGQGLIREYFRQSDGSYSPNFKIYARGMRNSMGLYWDVPNQLLIQAENGRDNITKYNAKIPNGDFPHEEMNFIKENNHYGWPYCFDNSLPNPEWQNINCDQYTKPNLLLPAHSSPLSILSYSGQQFPAWYKQRLILSFHGYEPRGHRIVTFLRDDHGLPTGKPLSIVYGWDAKGSQGAGSPVGLSEMKDGTILIVEDKNRKVLRLAYDPKMGDGKPVQEIPDSVPVSDVENQKLQSLKLRLEKILASENPPIFAQIQNQIIDKHCASCHSGTDARGLELGLYDFEGNEQRILSKNKSQEIFDRLKGGTALAQMPPDGFSSNDEKQKLLDLYLKWLQSHPN